MYPTNHATYQLVNIFGGNYISEQHGDVAQRRLPCSDVHRFAVDFDKLLRALRSALSVQRSA